MASHVAEDQLQVFAFLADPKTHGGVDVVRIDTHGAAVFLAGADVYKVRRGELSFHGFLHAGGASGRL
ncbi:hypothetical protein MWN34_00095 [Ancylobacter sp. 6x-1]|uniref:Uncharacterized protein n=1 Tax=Ancylobacter crimeensis TaxID=2579147 RepID=A0ABT0D5T9_9HYPH|nr:hypothetical protein [Ancylobacter crimeensis]MCK0195308.1 hypothetical protein [Ancylobacter crimeensis]